MISQQTIETRQQLVRQAARKLLRTEPFEHITFTKIMVTAGFSRDSGLHIYPSKAAIYLAVFERVYGRWARQFADMVANPQANAVDWLTQSLQHDRVVFILAPLMEPLVLAELPTPVVAGYRQKRYRLETDLGRHLDELRPKTVHGTGAQLLVHTLWTLSWIHGRRHGVAAEANQKAVVHQYGLAVRRLNDAITRMRLPS